MHRGRDHSATSKVRRLGALLLCASAAVHAEQPAVIHDSGRTIPIAQYFGFALEGASSSTVSPLAHFPVHTPQLRPGLLSATTRHLSRSEWLPQPVFVIGADARSRAWLTRWHADLERLGALGVVLEVADGDSFKSLQRIAAGIRLAPTSSPALVADLLEQGIAVYPLLIQTDGRIVATPQAQEQAR